MSEKDVFAAFDEMFAKLDNDEYKDTSIDEFKKNISDTMDHVAKAKGYDDFEKMADLRNVELFDVKDFNDREDYIIKALSNIKDATVQSYVERLKKGERVEVLEPELKNEVLNNKDNIALKLVAEAFDASKNKMIEKIHLEMAEA